MWLYPMEGQIVYIRAILYRASNCTETESDDLLYSGRQHRSLKSWSLKDCW
jgi:hypothetical protein